MKKVLLMITFLLSCCSHPETQSEIHLDVVGEISIIPEPVSIKRLGGQFELTRDTKIVATDESGMRAAATLDEVLMRNYGFELDVTDRVDLQDSITFSIASPDNGLADEGYFIKIQPGRIHIVGSERGMFYGMQTLNQMLPPNFDGNAMIPAAEIFDVPRFPYRGMHLDVARHFMSVEFVKKYIDLISRYKFNYFHWHLTDDQGWRIEIKKYPRLTEIGSKRSESEVGKNHIPYIGDHTPVEGFYSQDEIRDVVAFAKSKYVTIVPEIEMPAHSVAALAAYRELGCKTDVKYKVQTSWATSTNLLCPSTQTLHFIADVLGEVIELFPDSPYLHIGGDEVKPDQWRESTFVSGLKRGENLKTEAEVESWLFRRVSGFVNSHGRKIIGWDEIIGGGPIPEAVVMSWHDDSILVATAKARHQVITTPPHFTYFDSPQGDPAYEPITIGTPVTLKAVYNYEPVLRQLNEEESQYVIGSEGCVWTEFMKTPASAEYMAFPRALALAEVLWSNRANRDYAVFIKHLRNELPRLDRENVNYRIPEPAGLHDTRLSLNEEAVVDLGPPVSLNEKIYYTTDGTNPNSGSNRYDGPFVLNLPPNQTVMVKVRVIVSEYHESPVSAARYVRESRPNAMLK